MAKTSRPEIHRRKRGECGSLRSTNSTRPYRDRGIPRFNLHLFLDGSVLEVFVNGTTTLTARIYQYRNGRYA